jgi:hypothetical protein
MERTYLFHYTWARFTVLTVGMFLTVVATLGLALWFPDRYWLFIVVIVAVTVFVVWLSFWVDKRFLKRIR